MALCESSNWRSRRQNAMSKIVVFISANTFGAGGKTVKNYSKAIQSHSKEFGSPDKPF